MDASLEKDKGKVRLEWLDLGKAAGILVVLLVHAGCTGGPVTFYGGMFYMPVFFVAAGYTYRCREDETYGAYLKKRARRLCPILERVLFCGCFSGSRIPCCREDFRT